MVAPNFHLYSVLKIQTTDDGKVERNQQVLNLKIMEQEGGQETKVTRHPQCLANLSNSYAIFPYPPEAFPRQGKSSLVAVIILSLKTSSVLYNSFPF